jgi:methylated-DNA-[protein]-cysteine S-methyltransferase
MMEGVAGSMVAKAMGDELVGLFFDDKVPVDCAVGSLDREPFRSLRRWLDEYALGRQPSVRLKLRLEGTPFQRSVWAALSEIPFGRVTTYGALAERLDRPTSARAVGRAVGSNPVWVVAPCHRVVGAKGALTGYAGGLERKAALLRHEGVLDGLSSEAFSELRV